ncbi:hypothetical protein LC040_05975 [Bacillus tianshenii]|nr:hypothetical protein LC040_05975 [Bacillus tianshenii]
MLRQIYGSTHILARIELDTLLNYYFEVERNINANKDKFIDETKLQTYGLSEQDIKEFWDFHIDKYEELNKLFPNLLRRSILINAYSILESCLCSTYKYIEANYPELQNIRISKKISTIEKIKEKMTQGLDFNFPQTEQWFNILKYKNIRNKVIHALGKVSKEDWAYRDVQELPNVTIDIYSKEIVIEKDFCFFVIKDISDFLRDFFEQLNNLALNR